MGFTEMFSGRRSAAGARIAGAEELALNGSTAGRAMRRLKVATTGFLVLAACLVASCSRPPDDVLRQGIAQSAQTDMIRKNPFAVTAEVTLKDYKVTNSYKDGEAEVYEYEGTVLVKGGYGNPSPAGQEVRISGRAGFRKRGNRWESSPLF